MKLNFIVILLLSPFLLFSQYNSSIDFVGGLDYSFRILNTDSTDPIDVASLEKRNAEELAILGWRIGINYNRKLTNHLFLKSGLRLVNIGYTGEKMLGPRFPDDHDGNGGWKEWNYQSINRFFYLEIPLVLRYEIKPDKKFYIFTEMGITPSIFVADNSGIKTDRPQEDLSFLVDDAQNINRTQFVASISPGINYNINNNLQFFGQPVFRFHLNNLISESIIKENLWSVGLEIGIRKKIGGNKS